MEKNLEEKLLFFTDVRGTALFNGSCTFSIKGGMLEITSMREHHWNA